jgi:hypothetical protein
MSEENSVEEEFDFAKMAKFYEGFNLVDLIRKMRELRIQKDNMEAELKGIGRELEYVSKNLIPERFNAEGIKKMDVEGVGRVSLRADIYASIKSGQKTTAYQWLKDIGSEDLIQPAVAPSILKAFLKDRLKSGEDIPEDLFNVTPFQSATITKT